MRVVAKRPRAAALLAALVLAGFAAPGTAAAGDTMLKAGDAAPDFTLPAADGESRTLSESIRKSAVVLVFFRGVW